VAFFTWVLLSPEAKPELPFKRNQVLDISMVSMEEAALKPKEPAAEEKIAQRPEPPKANVTPPKKDSAAIPTPPKPDVKKPVSIAPKKPKLKTSLKKRTLKPKKVKKPEAPKPDPKSEVFKLLKEKVKADEASGRYKASVSSSSSIQATGQNMGAGAASRRRAELIDLYRVEIANRVNKNWNFPKQLAGKNKKLVTSLVFKVMPDGEIQDIFFLDRSGNQYLDDSALKAVKRAKPPPHPKGLVESFVDVGLRFTPEGIR
jgi:colicin import membrane protein